MGACAITTVEVLRIDCKLNVRHIAVRSPYGKRVCLSLFLFVSGIFTLTQQNSLR